MIKYIFLLIAICAAPVSAIANPGHAGSSGLINVPSAETLDAGNICLGAWSCYSENSNFTQKKSLVLPVSMTLGIGTFWEVYGAYPNILFNGDEDASGMGTLNIGTKLRFLGDRASTFKLAADFLAQRHISENRTTDGVTDLSGKLIASFNKDAAGVHVSAGYLVPGSISGTRLDNGYTLGVGIEYMLLPRMKLLGEFTAETKRYFVEDNPANSGTTMEVSAGIQYYLSPHLTVNVSAGTGLGAHGPDMTLIFGISSCQGVGSYVKPIPSVGRKAAVKDKSREALKPLKIIPISTLLLKASAAKSSPASTLEVEVDNDREEVLIKPFGQILIAPQQASSNLTSPVIPVEVAVQAHGEEISLLPQKGADQEPVAFDYIMSSVSGVTPLYGVDVKGATPHASTAVASSEPDIERAKKGKLHRKFKFSDVMFELGSSTLSSDGKKMLSEVADQIRNDTKWAFIRIDGHTDGIGSILYNMDLSLKRAVEAATFLVGNEGVDSSRIFIKGFGKTAPIADNSTAEGRRKNRRTEVLLFVSGDDK